MEQADLFPQPSSLPSGFRYQLDFLTPAEERELIDIIATLPLRQAQYLQFTAKRRIVSYGGSYDFSTQELTPAGPVPEFLHPLRARVAQWAGFDADELTHALIAEYQPGTQLGWHRDVPDFEKITGVSLAGAARMRLRPYPPKKGRRDLTIRLDLQPRSVYAMQAEARWGWQHAISPTKELRYSVTFRSLAASGGSGRARADRVARQVES